MPRPPIRVVELAVFAHRHVFGRRGNHRERVRVVHGAAQGVRRRRSHSQRDGEERRLLSLQAASLKTLIPF